EVDVPDHRLRADAGDVVLDELAVLDDGDLVALAVLGDEHLLVGAAGDDRHRFAPAHGRARAPGAGRAAVVAVLRAPAVAAAPRPAAGARAGAGRCGGGLGAVAVLLRRFLLRVRLLVAVGLRGGGLRAAAATPGRRLLLPVRTSRRLVGGRGCGGR